MHTRTLAILIALFLAAFAFSLSSASNASGTNSGSLWLLTSLILSIGLLATILAAIATMIRARSTRLSHSDPTEWHTSKNSTSHKHA